MCSFMFKPVKNATKDKHITTYCVPREHCRTVSR